jgi:hypothetical protein
MRKHIMIFCAVTTVFLPWNAFAANEVGKETLGIFICIDGPLRIRTGAGLAYEIIGNLETGERAAITAKSDYQDNIDGQRNYWYRIRRNNTQGYVFGGYGVVIADKIVIKSIDDFADKLPFKKTDFVRSVGICQEQEYPITVRFYYTVKLFDKEYNMLIDCRPSPSVTGRYLIKKYDIGGISDNYTPLGAGESYKILSDFAPGAMEKRHLENRYEPKGVFFLAAWKYIPHMHWLDNYASDIMAVFFENDINAEFDEILITVFDAYRGAVPDGLHADMIISNSDILIPELMVYQLLYEYFCHVQIDIDDAP